MITPEELGLTDPLKLQIQKKIDAAIKAEYISSEEITRTFTAIVTFRGLALEDVSYAASDYRLVGWMVTVVEDNSDNSVVVFVKWEGKQ